MGSKLEESCVVIPLNLPMSSVSHINRINLWTPSSPDLEPTFQMLSITRASCQNSFSQITFANSLPPSEWNHFKAMMGMEWRWSALRVACSHLLHAAQCDIALPLSYVMRVWRKEGSEGRGGQHPNAFAYHLHLRNPTLDITWSSSQRIYSFKMKSSDIQVSKSYLKGNLKSLSPPK